MSSAIALIFILVAIVAVIWIGNIDVNDPPHDKLDEQD